MSGQHRPTYDRVRPVKRRWPHFCRFRAKFSPVSARIWRFRQSWTRLWENIGLHRQTSLQNARSGLGFARKPMPSAPFASSNEFHYQRHHEGTNCRPSPKTKRQLRGAKFRTILAPDFGPPRGNAPSRMHFWGVCSHKAPDRWPKSGVGILASNSAEASEFHEHWRFRDQKAMFGVLWLSGRALHPTARLKRQFRRTPAQGFESAMCELLTDLLRSPEQTPSRCTQPRSTSNK